MVLLNIENRKIKCFTLSEQNLFSLEGSQFEVISSLNSLRTVLRSSSLNHFQSVGVWPDQSVFLEEKEAAAMAQQEAAAGLLHIKCCSSHQ